MLEEDKEYHELLWDLEPFTWGVGFFYVTGVYRLFHYFYTLGYIQISSIVTYLFALFMYKDFVL